MRLARWIPHFQRPELCYPRSGQVKRIATVITLGFCLAAVGYAADERDQRDRRQREKLAELTEKLNRRFDFLDPTTEQLWLHTQAAALLARAKSAQNDRYRFDRVAGATDALLEASERILEARRQDVRDENERAGAARALESDYFRVQQAEYFAKQGKETNAAEYTTLARSLYQQARRAYDRGEFKRARTLGDAAGYLARSLEALAQAAIRVPDPPRMP
jgi:hypothetical protein